MRLFQLVSEKIKNPLRKNALKKQGISPYFKNKGELETYKDYWMDFIVHSDVTALDREELTIRKNYEHYLKNQPRSATRYLESKLEEVLTDASQPKIEMSFHTKIYEQEGVQVFLDNRYVKDDFSPNSYNWRNVKVGVNTMLRYIRELMPNRKPRIVITDFDKHPVTRVLDTATGPAAGLYFKKIIYIDKRHIGVPDYYIHEYAHWVADRIPHQTEDMLWRAYNNIIQRYYSKIKKKKEDIQVEDKITDAIRDDIAKKIGFPSGYGLLNMDEFFAELIVNWKRMPNNPLTYKYKSMVKQVLNRL